MRSFSLDRAVSPADAMTRATHGNSSYIAGGTNLLDLMKLDVMRPERLVSINGLTEEHRQISIGPDELRLGALVRMSEAADHPAVRRDYPVLAESLWMAASPQLRNMASLGGNLLQRTRCAYFRDRTYARCNKRNPGAGCEARAGANRRLAVLGVSDHCIANYPGDFAIALVALGAEVETRQSNGGSRRIPLSDLHRLPGDTPHVETVLDQAELITSIHVPAGPWTRRSRYVKVRDRASYDFALASAAVALELTGNGKVATARIGLGGLATKPWRAKEAEDVVAGRRIDDSLAREAAEAALAAAVTHGDNAFKVELGKRTLTRALIETAAMEIQP